MRVARHLDAARRSQEGELHSRHALGNDADNMAPAATGKEGLAHLQWMKGPA